MKPVRFHDAARAELVHEILHYATISIRLGQRLAAAVEQAVELASECPGMGSPYKYGTRRVFPKKFPISLVYVVRKSKVYVLALAPFSRNLATGGRARMTANPSIELRQLGYARRLPLTSNVGWRGREGRPWQSWHTGTFAECVGRQSFARGEDGTPARYRRSRSDAGRRNLSNRERGLPDQEPLAGGHPRERLKRRDLESVVRLA